MISKTTHISIMHIETTIIQRFGKVKTYRMPEKQSKNLPHLGF